MNFKYHIKDMEIFGYHGLYDEEKKNGQTFILNIKYILNRHVINDNIAETLDYAEVMEYICEIFNQNRYNLLESLLNYLFFKLNKKYDFERLHISIQKNISYKSNSNIVKLIKSD